MQIIISKKYRAKQEIARKVIDSTVKVRNEDVWTIPYMLEQSFDITDFTLYPIKPNSIIIGTL